MAIAAPAAPGVRCPTCDRGAVLAMPIPGDAEGRSWFHCASCGQRWSSLACAVRSCRGPALAVCALGCRRALCASHGSRGRNCQACRSRRRRAARVARERRVQAAGVPYWAR